MHTVQGSGASGTASAINTEGRYTPPASGSTAGAAKGARTSSRVDRGSCRPTRPCATAGSVPCRFSGLCGQQPGNLR